MTKVFLSYSRKDSEFVEELYRRLRRDGVELFYDKESIAWGVNWVVELEKGIDEADLVVVVISPDFVQSKWATLERTSSDPQKWRPLLLADTTEIPRFLRPIQSIDVRTREKFEEQYPKICRALGGTPGTDNLLEENRAQLPGVKQLPKRRRMPYRSLGSNFAGRVADLWQLYDKLNQGQTAIVAGVGLLVGTGGLGKSQLAIEYAHRMADRYRGGVFWADADEGLATAIGQVAAAAGVALDGTLQVDDQAQVLWSQLGSGELVLVVLDNFPEQGSLRPWLPASGNIHTIVTTRRQDLTGYEQLTLGFLNEQESIDLLNGGERTFGDDALPLVKRLGGLPLALELMRNYLNVQTHLTVSDLMGEMDRLGEIKVVELFGKQYADELPSGHEKDIIATFELSWKLATPEAQAILQVIAMMAPTPVPCRLLRRILDLEKGGPLDDPLNNGITSLARLSLVELDEDRDPRAHRLVGGYVEQLAPLGDTARTYGVNELLDELSRVSNEQDLDAFSELDKVIPHGAKLANLASTPPETAVDICNYIGWQYRKSGKYRLAETFRRQALEMAEKHFEPGHPSIATSQSNLAVVHQDLGELSEAKRLLQLALASAEQSYEPGHPEIAIRQSNLALVHQDLGELSEAKRLLQLALASAEQSYEPGYPEIAIRQSNLAMVHKELGELSEAKRLLQLALASAEQSYEPGHPKIALRQSNLAVVHKDLGEFSEAKRLLQLALASDEQSYESGHPKIAISQSNLALVHQDWGELSEAKRLLQLTLASNKQSYEPGHPFIAKAQLNLATVHKALGELSEAKRLLQLALASNEQNYEPGHPSIAICQSNLAAVHRALGELSEAKQLLQMALASFLDLFGLEHPNTKTVAGNLDIVEKLME